MSVRRLAEDSVQPAVFAFNEENAAWAEATIRKYPEGRQQSAVIPLLMRAQEQDGWITRAAIEHVANKLDMPYIRVLEVATFYTQFQLKPVGTRAHIQVCGTTPCMLRGAEDLMKVCQHKIHHDPFELNADGTLSWEEVECQGACVNAPMVIIFKDAYEDLTPERLEEIIDAFEAGKGDQIKPGPQIDRYFSAPEGGPQTLLEDVKPVRTNLDAQPATDAAPVPPADAARPKDTAPETDQKLKTPATAPKAAANNVKAAEIQPLSGTAKSEAAASDAAKPATTKAEKPSLEDKNRPKGIDKPAEPDDLKMISGVGPKIEGILNELGIFTFAQVAAWKKAEREWVDGYLNFKGRIERDDWVKQAKALAMGGEAEYIKVFGKKPR
ncbi:NADH-quinone oxidoreductase subunit E [Neorhizobium sp. Rsf11]|uniref:NADH-quinone oxidoreductase subunit E n=2 Tax=Neorhizobium TaxID=1525371 RepID=A0ABV0M2X4_9HYPH|nr:NADH-quinone oxidoreductase subunit E [Neorhizobium petrolearium]MCC2609512.1 NADH-quinone oxidoreductase subunit E [Neorhizobium petrolearium]WGI69719.1 NADH-quinone oxidoreductase subunit E [Neorhizobium petrolearium]